VRKILISGLVATAALLGCAGPALAETGLTGKADGSTGTPIAGYWNGRTWKYGPMLRPAAA